MNRQVGSSGWPWARGWMGPPAAGEDGWVLFGNSSRVNSSLLYHNFGSGERQNFLTKPARGVPRHASLPAGNIALADAKWTAMWGCLKCGPFNTDCLQGHQHEQPGKGHYCRCSTYPQPMPPPMVYE